MVVMETVIIQEMREEQIAIKKYGDLCNIDNKIKDKAASLLKICLTDSCKNTFDRIWENVASQLNYNTGDDKYGSLYNAKLIPDDEDDNDMPYLGGDRKLCWKSEAKFIENIRIYGEKIEFYKDDVKQCVWYNWNYNKRKAVNKIDRTNDTWSVVSANDAYEVPFDLVGNNYTDFCQYTWRALYKNLDSMKIFLQSPRFNAGKTCFHSMLKSLECDIDYQLGKSRDNQSDKKGMFFMCEDIQAEICSERQPGICDVWLIEKITGISVALAMFPSVKERFDKRSIDEVLLPIIRIIVKCQPIQIRMHLADLVCEYLLESPHRESQSPYFNSMENQLYSGDSVERLMKVLDKVIERINCTYQLMCEIFMECVEQGELDILEVEQGNMVTSQMMDCGICCGREKDLIRERRAFRVILNQLGLYYVGNKLRQYPMKRTYNSGDLTWRFAYIQHDIIHEIHHRYFCETT